VRSQRILVHTVSFVASRNVYNLACTDLVSTTAGAKIIIIITDDKGLQQELTSAEV